MSHESDATSFRLKVQAFLTSKTKLNLRGHDDLYVDLFEKARESEYLHLPQAVADLVKPVFLSLVYRSNPGLEIEAIRKTAELRLTEFMVFLKEDQNWSNWRDNDASLENLVYDTENIAPVPQPEVHDYSNVFAAGTVRPRWKWSPSTGLTLLKRGSRKTLVTALVIVGIAVLVWAAFSLNRKPVQIQASAPVAVVPPTAPAKPTVTQPSNSQTQAAPVNVTKPITQSPAKAETASPSRTAPKTQNISELSKAQAQIRALEARVSKLEASQGQGKLAGKKVPAKALKARVTIRNGGNKKVAAKPGCVPYIIDAEVGRKPRSGYFCP